MESNNQPVRRHRLLTALQSLTLAIAEMPVPKAVAVIVSVAVVSASIVSYIVWWLATDVMPAHVIPISALVALIVAAPIATYLISVIHTLSQSRAALAELSEDLTWARDEAWTASKAKSTFLASTSHELRTPLNAIIGFSEILKNELFGPSGEPRYVEYATYIHKSGTHLLNVINDVLDLSKIESGRLSIDTHEQCDLTEIIHDSLNIVDVLAKSKGIRIRYRHQTQSIGILANNRFMHQLLLNLLSNAVKFTTENGTVEVCTSFDETRNLLIKISDTGIGMTEEEVDVALKPFGQINSHHSRQHSGTGLGLPLAKAMVEAHDGSLFVHSVPNKGTSVIISIPQHRLIEKAKFQATGR